MFPRTNTLFCSFESGHERPSVNDIMDWIFGTLQNQTFDFSGKLQGVQIQGREMFLKFSAADVCHNIIAMTRGFSEIITTTGVALSVRISLAMVGGRRVLITRLPFEVSNEDVRAELSKYGQVESIEHEYWPERQLPVFRPLKNGNRIAHCLLRIHIPVNITVKGHRATVLYKNQPKRGLPSGGYQHAFSEWHRSLNDIMENEMTYVPGPQEASTSFSMISCQAIQQEHQMDVDEVMHAHGPRYFEGENRAIEVTTQFAHSPGGEQNLIELPYVPGEEPYLPLPNDNSKSQSDSFEGREIKNRNRRRRRTRGNRKQRSSPDFTRYH